MNGRTLPPNPFLENIVASGVSRASVEDRSDQKARSGTNLQMSERELTSAQTHVAGRNSENSAESPNTFLQMGAGTPALEVIRSDSRFRGLFQGFQRARLITYVSEPEEILALFERIGFSTVDIIISESFNEVKGQLEAEVIGKLKERIESGRLRLYVPKQRTKIHTKLYILENPDHVRLIFTSRNLYSSRSIDIALTYDLPEAHPLVQETISIYDEHLKSTEPFFGDLFDRIRAEPDAEKQLIEAFLADPDSNADRVPVLLADAALVAIQRPDLEVLTIQIPESKSQRKRLESELSKSGFNIVEGNYLVDTKTFRAVVSRTVQLPVMIVDRGSLRVTEMIDGEVVQRAATPPTSPHEVASALQHIEDYMATIDVEQAPDQEKQVHKTALMEVLLYLFSSPFSHELMLLMQHHYGLVQKRGPRFLLVYGQTHRGKTTFLAFVLSLVAGKRVDPLSSKTYFKEGFIRQALAYRTTFPLIFDDMLSVSTTQFEGIVKDYWEKNWNSGDPVPQLVFSANRSTLRQSVVTRVKKVYFPVFIEPTPDKKKVLNQLREREVSNHLFEWFSHVYLELLSAQEQPPPDDELFLARIAMKRLYTYAGRPIPDYFPNLPFERLYDTSKVEWNDMVYGLKKAQLKNSGDRILVEFTQDMSREDVLAYASILPLAMDHEVKGNTIIINSAERFRIWLPVPNVHSQPFAIPSLASPPTLKPTLGQRLRHLVKGRQYELGERQQVKQ